MDDPAMADAQRAGGYTYEMPKAPLPADRSEVGIRELRDHLSAWLGAVAAGREITVTDRGKPVARIVPVTGRTKLDQLIAEGKVRPPLRPPRPASSLPAIEVEGSVSDIVIEQRQR
jgi:prevent-host-death family protein